MTPEKKIQKVKKVLRDAKAENIKVETMGPHMDQGNMFIFSFTCNGKEMGAMLWVNAEDMPHMAYKLLNLKT